MFLFPPHGASSYCDWRKWSWDSSWTNCNRLCLKCDDTRAESSFRLSTKRASPFKSAGASVQSITGSRGVRISGSNAGYTCCPNTITNKIKICYVWLIHLHILIYTLAPKWRIFQIIVTFFYFQYKKIMLTTKQPGRKEILITQLRNIISERWRPSCLTHVRKLSSKFCISFTNISCDTVAISSRMETFRSSTVRGFRA